jgi:hypothetical protein
VNNKKAFCTCEFCNQVVEFDASHCNPGESVTLGCCFCKNEFQTVVSDWTKPPVLRPTKNRAFVFWIAAFFFVSFGVAALLLFVPTSEKWEKSGTIKQGDVEVKIVSAAPGMLFMENGEGLGVTPTMNYFLVKVRVANLNPNKTIDFSTWRSSGILDSSGGTISDNFGNSYKRILFNEPLLNCEDEFTIYPNRSFTDTLVFQIPVQNYQWLHLSLDASNFGGSGTLRFEIAK